MADSSNNFQPDETPPGKPLWEEAGNAQVPLPLLSLCRLLPELLYVLYDAQQACYCYRKLSISEDCGLLCFLDPQQAHAYLRTYLAQAAYDSVQYVTLDQAHAIARERHALVNCLILVDEAFYSSVHYIK